MTIQQAVLMYTSRAARMVDFPGLGSIRPGNEAAFVTLSQDIYTEPSEEISSTTVTGTWVRGHKEYEAPASV